MTCKDCIHYDMCQRRINSIDFLPVINGKIGKSPVMFKNCDDVEIHCKHFKDKSKYIELPCKVGDTVYSYCYEFGYILPYFVENINIGFLANDRTYISFEANSHADETDELIDEIDFDLEDIGKTVFLTESEAEQKLKEMQNR